MTRKELIAAIEKIIDDTTYAQRDGEFVGNTDDAAVEIVQYLETECFIAVEDEKVLDIFAEL